MNTFIHDGRNFRLDVEQDDAIGAPWKEHDGHGVVSEWTTRDKRAGERVLASDRNSRRFYDVQASTAIALRDKWGGEGRTAREKAAHAVEADFQRLRAWCADEWQWVYVKVTLLDGRDAGEFETLGGIESDSTEYIQETARELAGELLHRVVTLRVRA